MNLDFMDRMRADFDKEYKWTKINRPRISIWWQHMFDISLLFEDIEHEGKVVDNWDSSPDEIRLFYEYVRTSDPDFMEQAIKLRNNLTGTKDIYETEKKLAMLYKEEEEKYENEVKVMIQRWNNFINTYKEKKNE